MPRRNHRPELDFEPLDLTPDEAMRSRPSPTPLRSRDDVRRDQEARLERERALAERQRNARVNGGIDWSICLVPGCGHELTAFRGRIPEDSRHHTLRLPMCLEHLAVAHAQAVYKSDDPLMIEAATNLIERRSAKADEAHEQQKRAHLSRTNGHMYYVRANGLIKVGWTRDLQSRLRAYGPDVQVLVHYPATRDDETNLHRQLRPFLAKGREWYQDCPALADFINAALETHGPPTVAPQWTTPKATIRPRKRSA